METLQIDREAEWTLLPLNDKMPKSYHLGAVEFNNKILIFGGHPSKSLITHLVSEDGELEQDYSASSLVPGLICNGSFVIQEQKVFAVSQYIENNKWE